MRIIVTGSLAYDYIMAFPGSFQDHIVPEMLHKLTISFLVDSMRRMRGGVAGNIAYTLALLGERPLVLASAGQDFGEYRGWMERQGIDTTGIHEVAEDFTASCFINTDRNNNQIVAFYPGAASYSRHLSLEDVGVTADDIVIISPTDPDAMVRHAEECRRIGARFVFDPGKQTPRLTGDQIVAGMDGATALVGNDYEFAMMAQATGRSVETLLHTAPLAVVTRGEHGSTIYDHRHGTVHDVPPAPVDDVVDPTGAGDAYLGGLVFGLARGLPLPVTGRVAALAASYAIERRGCQEHTFTSAEFAARYEHVFGATPSLNAPDAAVTRW